ncbi:DNA-binding PadR family transcriptional regulator [Nocardiopsis mwathae]|uniref:DNA-binding PadR family transcriptional regulator n=1 Tax=Nocardiopsis mwathae TaxID=1472723 RepID=A0A7X0D6Y3_9ACTN|nr:PadR family transcriptional regulator [Nocardiopsis mwathae]MBB6173181.1 DNA-binding PadR family transcriptional regulator [Nocardiopsis mwathae]
MSTIFGHGRLRLYLLKLLDESPRHGYEIISLLRDRFLGVYSPSPGTIYPRLARLEEEGLVTHEEVNGRKVYRLTDKGREELHSRRSDLDDLEREITESVRDVARAVKEDVRDTISSLREELKFAAGGGRRNARTERDQREEQEERERASAPDATGAAEGSEKTEEREERDRRDGTWWERDWERFAENIGSWGSTWTKQGRRGEPLEFEKALHDFSDRVRDVVREAGHVGESAAQDLRRILDDTIEVIRRDVSAWGPPPSPADQAGETKVEETEPRQDTTEPKPEERPKPSPKRPDDESTTPPHGDPWSTAVAEEPSPKEEKDDRDDKNNPDSDKPQS